MGRGRGRDLRWSSKPLIGRGAVSLLLFLLLACTPYVDQYLAEATGRASQEDVRQSMGQPTRTRAIDGGGEVWSYQMKHVSYAGGAGATNCYQYLLTFDKQKILRKWDVQKC
jgi:hypothetical protein